MYHQSLRGLFLSLRALHTLQLLHCALDEVLPLCRASVTVNAVRSIMRQLHITQGMWFVVKDPDTVTAAQRAQNMHTGQMVIMKSSGNA